MVKEKQYKKRWWMITVFVSSKDIMADLVGAARFAASLKT